jgi:hypothetical protein
METGLDKEKQGAQTEPKPATGILSTWRTEQIAKEKSPCKKNH